MNRRYPALQSFGYVVSILSVALLALVALLSGDGRLTTRAMIVLGAGLAILGMLLRWFVWSRRHGRNHKHRHGHKR